MEKGTNRRNFLQKTAALLSGALIAGKAGLAVNERKEMQEDPIKSIRPMGFQWETQDPFLFCVHHEDHYPKGNSKLGPDASLEGRHIGQDFVVKDGWRMYHGDHVPGFPGHPHRGFETITVVRTGFVDHSDSLGAAGRYGFGDVQWMTAGKGVQHAEMFPLVKSDANNPLELFQIWLNLPKANKFVEPHFKMLWADSIPNVTEKDASGKSTMIEVLAGKLGTNKAPDSPPNSWANSSENDVAIWNIQMEAGAVWTMPKAAAGVNRSVYLYEGDSINIGGHGVKNYHAADVKADSELTITAGPNTCKILVLQGRPINEPVVQHGPFVMNSREEIQQAFADYQRTQFGGWPWKESGPTHGKTRGRFALHADGKLEEKS
jgi:redox-sensitive bicupin YhaK (pirin superfamily)